MEFLSATLRGGAMMFDTDRLRLMYEMPETYNKLVGREVVCVVVPD